MGSRRNTTFVLVVVLAMLLILAAAALVVTYVAYPARGREVPRAPWLGNALARGADRVGLADDDAGQPETSEQGTAEQKTAEQQRSTRR